jgi:hypothetical protein
MINLPEAKQLYANERYALVTGLSVRNETKGEWCYQLVSLGTGIVEYEDYLYPRIRFLADRFDKDAAMAEKAQGEDEFGIPPLAGLDNKSIN